MLLIATKSGFCELSAIGLGGGETVEMMNCSDEVVVKVEVVTRGRSPLFIFTNDLRVASVANFNCPSVPI